MLVRLALRREKNLRRPPVDDVWWVLRPSLRPARQVTQNRMLAIRKQAAAAQEKDMALTPTAAKLPDGPLAWKALRPMMTHALYPRQMRLPETGQGGTVVKETGDRPLTS